MSRQSDIETMVFVAVLGAFVCLGIIAGSLASIARSLAILSGRM